MTTLEADYVVVGAGAAGMAFTDALIGHDDDATVVMVDRRRAVGGHWQDAYPFVRLHQASAFYGVASTLLGGGQLQQDGPESGLQERASAPEIRDYYDEVLHEKLLASGRVAFHGGCEYLGDGRFASLESGKTCDVRTRRVVNAHYLSPQIPIETPAPFLTHDDAHVVPVNDLPRYADGPSQYVIVGSGKTATDACVWLIDNGIDPDAICWVRPRDPWMLNRAVVQPNPVVVFTMVADTMQAAAEAESPDDMFLRLEDAGVMLRIDPSATPSMAKTPTLAQWELDRLRMIENVVRLGHIRGVEPGRLVLADGEAAIARDAVVVHCAASGLQYPPLVPIWGRETITLQPVRSGFPCFGAALAGYVEATIDGDDEKNRLCPPSPLANTPMDWARMQVLGYRAAASFGSHPDIKAWADTVPLNPARITTEHADSPALAIQLERIRRYEAPGIARMTEFAGLN